MEQDTINQVALDQSAQVHATTAFTADDNSKAVQPHGPVGTSYDILSNRDYSDLSLHQLLSQPVPISSGVLTTPAFPTFTLASHSSLIAGSSFHREKLRGYLGIRATSVLRLVCNADKYTQGSVVVAFLPSSTETIERRSDHRLITQLHHVELDLNTETEVTLRVPHRGPYTHFNIVDRKYDTGVFIIAPVLSLRGNPVPYTIYQSFEDVDLMGPTGITQFGYEGRIEEEEKNRPISTTLSKIGNALTVAASVPVLTAFVEPMAWASHLAAGVASAFGYSKPCQTTTPNVYVRRSAGKINHSDGADYAEQLAMTTTSGVRVTDQIGLTDHDEMSFAYLCGIRSQVHKISYGITTPQGTKLLQIPLDPFAQQSVTNFAGDGGPQNNVMRIFSPMAYVANMFGMYRGSLEITLQISKTIFHSGRLMVVFEPVSDDTFNPSLSDGIPTVNTIAEAVNCHKDIVDIRSGNKFSFTFPWTSLTPYKPVGRPYGYVHVFVLNSLVRNDAAVSDIVDIGVRVSACDDMEFAAPGDPISWPAVVSASDTSNVTDARTLDGVVYQSGLEVSDTLIVAKPIGSSSKPTPTVKFAELCIGEKIMSMKQVAMRGKIVETNLGIAPHQQDPFVVDRFYQAAIGTPATKQWFDFYSYAGAPFCYGRGGCIITIVKNSDNLAAAVCVKNVEFDIPSEPFDAYGEYCAILPMHSNSNADRVYVPPYNCSFVRYNHATPGNNGVFSFFKDNGYNQTKIKVLSYTGNGNNDAGLSYELFRSAAEDTQFGGFQGIPYMARREPYSALAGGGINLKRIVPGYPDSSNF